MSKVCVVVATLFTARAFLREHLRELARRYDLTLVANGADAELPEDIPLRLVTAPIERRISPLADLRALLVLYRLFRRERFGAVHSVTPKAGLLSMLAAFAARVPVRTHTFSGQVWATRTGVSRHMLKAVDRILAAAATHVLADSPSQLAFLRQQGILGHGVGEVLGKGSISGVDPLRFKPDPSTRAAVRTELAIGPGAIVFVFVGRLSRDKGVLDLARAFASVAARHPGVQLLLVGPDEDHLADAVHAAAGPAAGRLRLVGMTDAPEHYMAAGDVFCLPSYREGFGAVIIEAAAAGLPAIGSCIYGITDAIENGTTGLLVSAGDVDGLSTAMLTLATHEQVRLRLAHAARERALRDFSSSAVTAALISYYERVLPDGATQRP
jgi:glycosyltransferase involved in cell wall biosynthesis